MPNAISQSTCRFRYTWHPMPDRFFAVKPDGSFHFSLKYVQKWRLPRPFHLHEEFRSHTLYEVFHGTRPMSVRWPFVRISWLPYIELINRLQETDNLLLQGLRM